MASAADICLVSNKIEDMRTMLKKLEEKSDEVSLKINTKKTVEMIIGIS